MVCESKELEEDDFSSALKHLQDQIKHSWSNCYEVDAPTMIIASPACYHKLASAVVELVLTDSERAKSCLGTWLLKSIERSPAMREISNEPLVIDIIIGGRSTDPRKRSRK